MKYLGILLCFLTAFAAVARTPESALGLIQAPHNGWPAVVRPGDSFEAVLQQPAGLRLVRPEAALSIALEVTPTPTGTYRVDVPADAPLGAYALEAEADGVTDTTVRAVYVVGAVPESYVVAHIAAPAVGVSAQEEPHPAAAALRAAVQTANSAGANLCIVTGNLTQSGQPAEFRDVLALLDTCAAPTYVAPGPADDASGQYRQHLGEADGVFWYGPDGYLAIDTTLPLPVDPLGDDLARLQIRRRAIKPARWSIGLAARYVPRMSMRAQLILFADDALDYLLVSEIEALGEEVVLPWPKTIGITPPKGEPGVLLQVTPQGISTWTKPDDVAEETPSAPVSEP
jgi:hypothetical protein